MLVTGWDVTAIGLGFAFTSVLFIVTMIGAAFALQEAGANLMAHAATLDKAAASKTSVWSIARYVAWRNLRILSRSPTLLLPAVLLPLFFLIAFAGAL